MSTSNKSNHCTRVSRITLFLSPSACQAMISCFPWQISKEMDHWLKFPCSDPCLVSYWNYFFNTDLYQRNPSGTVPACHRLWASNVHPRGGKSSTSRRRRRFIPTITARHFLVWGSWVQWRRHQNSQPTRFTKPEQIKRGSQNLNR